MDLSKIFPIEPSDFRIFLSNISDIASKFVYLLYFPRNKPSKSVTVGPGRVGSSFHTIQLVLKWS